MSHGDRYTDSRFLSHGDRYTDSRFLQSRKKVLQLMIGCSTFYIQNKYYAILGIKKCLEPESNQ